MRAAQGHLDQVEGDSPPGFGVPPQVVAARAAAAFAEQNFATRLVELLAE